MAARSIGATGFDYRRLEAEGVDDFVGAGVYYGASPSDVIYHRGGDVFVVGGANSAGQAALHLAAHARSVTLLVRGESIEESMSQYLVDRCGRHAAITVRTEHRGRARQRRREARADRRSSRTARRSELPADALFILIGGTPSTAELPVRALARDPHGFVLTGPDLGDTWKLDRAPYFLESSQPGVLLRRRRPPRLGQARRGRGRRGRDGGAARAPLPGRSSTSRSVARAWPFAAAAGSVWRRCWRRRAR